MGHLHKDSTIGGQKIIGTDNIIYSANARTEGAQNVAGGKAYKIISQIDNEDGTGQYELRTASGLELEMEYSIRTSFSKPKAGIITAINTENDKVFVSVKNFQTAALNTYEDEFENYSVNNYMMIVGHPELGDIEVGFNAHAEGQGCIAHDKCTHVEGRSNQALAMFGHAEGRLNTVGYAAHVEGRQNEALGDYSHAEGYITKALGIGSSASGTQTTTQESAKYSHVEGFKSKTVGEYSHAEGENCTSVGQASHAEGESTTSIGDYSHAEGTRSNSVGKYSHAEGGTKVSAKSVIYEDDGTIKSNDDIHNVWKNATNKFALALGEYSHSEGFDCVALNDMSHAEGQQNFVRGESSHAEGYNNFTGEEAYASHVEGGNNIVNHKYSHAEGYSNEVSGNFGHAEGYDNTITAQYGHAEGFGNKVSGENSHAEGIANEVTSARSHVEGSNNKAYAYASHVEGERNIARYSHQHVQGKWNKEGNYAHIVGNGKSETERSNAYTLDWNGNAWFAGKVTIGTDKLELATKNDLQDVQIKDFTIEASINIDELTVSNISATYIDIVGAHSQRKNIKIVANGACVLTMAYLSEYLGKIAFLGCINSTLYELCILHDNSTTLNVLTSSSMTNVSYATYETPGILTVGNGFILETGKINIREATDIELQHKCISDSVLTPNYLDYAVKYSTHQDMSDDYNVNSLYTSEIFTENKGDLPVSYNAVKAYIDELKTEINTLKTQIATLTNN